jgi:hypothetical protein
MRVIVNCKVCELVTRLYGLVVMSCKNPKYPIYNRNPVSSHLTRGNIYPVLILSVDFRVAGKRVVLWRYTFRFLLFA